MVWYATPQIQQVTYCVFDCQGGPQGLLLPSGGNIPESLFQAVSIVDLKFAIPRFNMVFWSGPLERPAIGPDGSHEEYPATVLWCSVSGRLQNSVFNNIA